MLKSWGQHWRMSSTFAIATLNQWTAFFTLLGIAMIDFILVFECYNITLQHHFPLMLVTLLSLLTRFLSTVLTQTLALFPFPSFTSHFLSPRTAFTLLLLMLQFSLYTRTEQPAGLLLFVGTPVGGHEQMRRTKTDDFMALEIVKGFARLTMDLGSGPDSIENRNVYLSDGVWRKISVDR